MTSSSQPITLPAGGGICHGANTTVPSFEHMTQRFASSMVFMSLLLSAELGVLFNSSGVTTEMRAAMINHNHTDMKFYIGILVILSVFLTLFTLIATFCAWGMVSAVSSSNAHCMLRSSVGQYVTQLPSRLLVSSEYCFIVWMRLWLLELLPGPVSTILLAAMATLFVHIIASFSTFGRLLMLSGAMGSERILEEEFEQALLPSGLHTALLLRATERQKKRLTVTAQYSTRRMPMPAQRTSASSANGPEKTLHKRTDTIDTLDSATVGYMIQKTADAFSEKSLQADAEGIAQGPLVPSIVSPSDDIKENSNEENYTSPDKEWGRQAGDKEADRYGIDEWKSNDDRRGAVSFDKEYYLDNSASSASASSPSPGRQRTQAQRRFGGFTNSIAIEREWVNDEEARSMYNRPPAAKLDDNASMQPSMHDEGSQFNRLPPARVLNSVNHSRRSISRLTDSILEDEEGRDLQQNAMRNLLNATNKGVEPFAHFIRRLKDGEHSDDNSNGRGSLVAINEEVIERGEVAKMSPDCEMEQERRHLLGDSSPKRTAYTLNTESPQQS